MSTTPDPSLQGELSLAGGAARARRAALDALLRHAAPADASAWDELRAGDGGVRPVWRRFAAAVDADADGLDAAHAAVAQQILRDGVTHNVFGEADVKGAAARPWSLELLPMLIEPADWAQLEAGVRQRAALLEAVLADLYGERRLLHEGLLPPALLLRHPGYLRPLHGVVPPGGQRLYIAAFDVARGPDGRWWLVAQRTQGPSGLGYVLHNRLLISRAFPDAFRDLRVQHIASSYRRLLDALEARAAGVAGGATPRLVLMTPGRFSETYFEHAYLARYLGLPLVEGGDLTVRGEDVFLKTVDGLEPVHGILRRTDDDWCDPLELRTDSRLGVPGLLHAVRAGRIVLANALGSAVLETPALQGFLPAIAERLTGEALQLPALPTWWCGEAAAWNDVRGRLGDKLLRSSFPRAGRTSQVLAPPQADVDGDPDAWTVQGRLAFSRVPLWQDGRTWPRPAMLRVYAVSDADGRWHVLPGGMTRAAQKPGASVSMQRGGSSLDTWVLTDGAVDTFSMLPSRLTVDDIAGRRRPVTSRSGENLFWLGRYTERSDKLVRLARATLALLDGDTDAGPAVLATLSDLAVRRALVPPGVPTLLQSPTVFERALLAGLVDAQDAFSVAFDLQAMARAAQALRERLSVEQATLLRRLPDEFAAACGAAPGQWPTRQRALVALEALALQLSAVTGAQTDRMTRDAGWRLLATGRLIERLAGVAARLDAFLGGGALASPAGIDLALELFDSGITFRARYQRHDDLLALVDLLVLDDTNPRSVAGVLRRLRTELGKLPGGDAARAGWLALLPAQGAGIALQDLRGLDDAAIAARVRPLVQTLGEAAASLSDRIGDTCFALAAADVQLQEGRSR